MSPINAVIQVRTNRHPLLIAHHAFVEFGPAGAQQDQWAAEPSDTALATPVAFAGLIDLMRSRASEDCGEICEECKTLNRMRACYCKACAHKLPAYYASANVRAPMVLKQRRERAGNRTVAWDLAAVWVVLSSLVLMTAFIPVG